MTDISSCLFQSYNFYVDFIIAQLKDRFKAVTGEPISLFTIFNYQLWPIDQNSEAFSLFGDNEINKLVEQFKPLYSTEERVNIKMEWLSYKTFGLAKVKQFKADYKNVCGTDELQCSDEGDDDTDGCDSDDDEIANRLAPKKPGVMSAAPLCFDMFANREMFGITNICLLLNHMIVISPSNAHTERQIKFMNNIKTLHRTSLGQNKLNNQFKIAGNSKIGKDFNPQPFVDHYVKKSIQAKDAEQKIVLSCGQEVPNVLSKEKLQNLSIKSRKECPAKSNCFAYGYCQSSISNHNFSSIHTSIT